MITPTQQEIVNIDAKIAQVDAQISSALNSARDWRASKNQCAGTKKKKEECAKGKEDRAVVYDQQVASLNIQKEQLLATKATLKTSVIAENTATVNLSSQGLSNQALIIAATGQANAAQQSAQIRATAEATAIEKESGSKVFTNQMIYGIAALVTVVIVVVVVKKVSGKKKTKKQP